MNQCLDKTPYPYPPFANSVDIERLWNQRCKEVVERMPDDAFIDELGPLGKVFVHALRMNASDIFLDSFNTSTKIRVRSDSGKTKQLNAYEMGVLDPYKDMLRFLEACPKSSIEKRNLFDVVHHGLSFEHECLDLQIRVQVSNFDGSSEFSAAFRMLKGYNSEKFYATLEKELLNHKTNDPLNKRENNGKYLTSSPL